MNEVSKKQTLREIEDAYVRAKNLTEKHCSILCFLFLKNGYKEKEGKVARALQESSVTDALEQLSQKHLIGYAGGSVRLTYAGIFAAGVIARRQHEGKV